MVEYDLQLKLFHSELLSQLEQKLELDIKYLTVSLSMHFPLTYFLLSTAQPLFWLTIFLSVALFLSQSDFLAPVLSRSQATLKKYQSERKSKSESIERCQSQLKKLRRKSQGSRHPNKYGDREMQVTGIQQHHFVSVVLSV